jgi:hypothetical protein
MKIKPTPQAYSKSPSIFSYFLFPISYFLFSISYFLFPISYFLFSFYDLPCPAVPCPAVPCPAVPCPVSCVFCADRHIALSWQKIELIFSIYCNVGDTNIITKRCRLTIVIHTSLAQRKSAGVHNPEDRRIKTPRRYYSIRAL